MLTERNVRHSDSRNGKMRFSVLVLKIMYRYDIAQYLADRYKLLAKFLFIVQLLLSFTIVVAATLLAESYCSDDDSANGEENQPAEGARIVNDSRLISALGETAFVLTVAASFLLCFDSYINAKVRANLYFESPLNQTPKLHPPAYLPHLPHVVICAVHAVGRRAGGSCGRARAHWNQSRGRTARALRHSTLVTTIPSPTRRSASYARHSSTGVKKSPPEPTSTARRCAATSHRRCSSTTNVLRQLTLGCKGAGACCTTGRRGRTILRVTRCARVQGGTIGRCSGHF